MPQRDYIVTAEPVEAAMHVVHDTSCDVLPDHLELVELGSFDHCEDAVEEARDQIGGPVNGCELCSPDCHEPIPDEPDDLEGLAGEDEDE